MKELKRVGEWREVALGDVLTLQRGFDITKAHQRPGPIPVVSSSGISSHHDQARAEGPGVVIGRKGSLGTAFYLQGSYWPHDTTLWVKDFKGNDPYYCYLLLKSLRLGDFDSGAANPTLNRNHVHRLPVRMPCPGAQRRIAAVLSAMDRLVACNHRRIRCLEQTGAAIFKSWFEYKGLRHGQMRPATDVFDLNPRVAPGNAPISKVAMADVGEVHSYVFPSNHTDRCLGSRFQRDDVLLARITPCLENGKTALVKFLAPGEMAVGSTEFIVMRGRSVGPAFTYFCARSERLRSHAIKSMSGSSGRQRVSVDAFASLQVYEPSPEKAQEFESAVGPMLEQVYCLAAQNRRLAATRDLLLPRLVSGRLDISDVDIGVLTPEETAA
jgi:type I restriction enzyme S subunit